jgi:hypothetical protein
MADESGLAQVSPFEKMQSELKAQYDSVIKVQNDLMASLNTRQNTGNPLLALAQGFLAPTRGGGFGESASNALQSMAAQQQQEQKQSQETAMMRMQLAQASLAPYKEKYGMERENAMGKALMAQLGGSGVGGATGTNVLTAGSGATTGGAGVVGGMPESIRKAIASRVSFGDTAGALELRDKWVMDDVKKSDEQRKAEFLASTQPNPAAAIAEYATNFFNKPTLENDALIQKAVIDAAKSGADIANIIKGLPPGLAAIVTRSLEKVQALRAPTGNAPKPTDAQGSPKGSTSVPQFNNPAIISNTPPAVRIGSGLSMEQQAEVEKTKLVKDAEADIAEQARQRTERAKPFEAKDKALAPYADINFVETNNSRYDELLQLVGNKNNADVFGLLSSKQGPIYALLAGAQEGMQTPIGSLSLPIVTMIKTSNLSPEKQAVARNVMQILADLNQTVMRAGKDIYGPQISVFDAQKMAEPGFMNTDPASFIKYLAQKQKITNEYMGKMANERERYFDAKPKATTASFYNSETYRDIAKEYHSVFRRLIANSPYR